MKPNKLLLPLGALLLGAFSAQAAPLESSQLPKQANWFIHADLDNLRETSVGKLVMTAVEEEHGDQLKAVKRMFSLNPFTDLHGVSLWGNGEKDQAVVLINATFDREHLTDLIGAADDHKTSDYHGNAVHSWTDKKEDGEKKQHGAFHGEDLIIIGENKKLVLQTLDVLDKRSDAMEHTPGAKPAAFLLGVASLQDIDIQGEGNELLEKAKSLQLCFFEKDDRLQGTLIIETNNAKDAERFSNVLKGVISLGELGNEDVAGLNLITDIGVKNDTHVHATISIPSDKILEAIKEAGALRDR